MSDINTVNVCGLIQHTFFFELCSTYIKAYWDIAIDM